MNYAIVRISGKQYQVEEGQEVLVERLDTAEASACDFADVLLLRKEGTVYVGDPFVKDAVVKAQIMEHVKGKKMYISKFKAKVNFNKTIGFRPQLTRLKIDAIRYGNEPVKAPAKAAPKEVAVEAQPAEKPVKKTVTRKPRVAKAK